MKLWFLLLISLLVFTPTYTVQADSLGQVANFGIAPEYDTKSRTNMPMTLRHISDRTYWYVADEYWNAISEGARIDLKNKIAELASEFDTKIYPTETAVFGSEPNPGIDGDPRITMALMPMQNSAGGYIDTGNNVSRKLLPRSNEREMVYLNINLINDSSRIKSYLAHEFQHLITLYERDIVRDSPDDVWLNELRSEYAVDILGYNYQSNSTNIQRRALTFLQNTKDSLTEWKNELIDYSSIALFANYVGSKFGRDVIGQTTRVKESGINALTTVLKQKGFNINFDQLFVAWWSANILNDPKSKWYGYQNDSLRNFAVKPEKIITINSYYPVDVTSLQLKDWQGGWYQINYPEKQNQITKINFNSSSLESFGLGIIRINFDGTYDVSTTNLSKINSEINLDWNGNKIARILIMPFKHDRLAGFTDNETAVGLSFSISNIDKSDNIKLLQLNYLNLDGATVSMSILGDIVLKDFGLTEGDFIKSVGNPDIFIINEYGHKRLVLNPAICLMYGHLGARGCFSAVKDVASNINNAFKLSWYVTNGETRDNIVYQLIQIDDDHAYLKKATTSVEPKTIFKINTKEFKSYELR